MDDLAKKLSCSAFESALETAFQVTPGENGTESLEMRLVEVKSRSSPPGWEQFSALFLGPATPIWPQGIYRFVHPALGDLDLFMVPVARATRGVEYEVCISRESVPKPG